jgi:hypothetical protein
MSEELAMVLHCCHLHAFSTGGTSQLWARRALLRVVHECMRTAACCHQPLLLLLCTARVTAQPQLLALHAHPVCCCCA